MYEYVTFKRRIFLIFYVLPTIIKFIQTFCICTCQLERITLNYSQKELK